MAKYFGVGGLRKGKVGNEKYYLRSNKNFIQEAKKYIPINSNWLTKEEFKNYVLSLLDEGVPQVYVLNELPEEKYLYALIFVQNQQGTNIYVDKEGIRTLINLQGGEEEADAVDIVNEVPEEPKNNTIYFVNNNANKEKKIDKKDLKDTPLECDIYVCDNNVLRKIEVDNTEVLNEAKAYTDEKVSSLPISEVVTSLPSVMENKKIYFVTNTHYLVQDNYDIYINQDGQKMFLGHIQQHPTKNSYLYFKRVSFDRSKNNIYCTITYYAKDGYSPNFSEVWNFLNNAGCNNQAHQYPAAGYVGTNAITGIYNQGSSSSMQIYVYTMGKNGAGTSYIYNDNYTTITSSVKNIINTSY